MLRFRIPAEQAASVHLRAKAAVERIENLVDQYAHYQRVAADAAGREVAAEGRAGEAVLRAQTAFDQLGAVRDDLVVLADDARQQGSEVLRTARFSRGPKADLSLKPPGPDAPLFERALTQLVLVQSIGRACREVSESLDRLVSSLNTVADPAVLLFASQLDGLARQMRPPAPPA